MNQKRKQELMTKYRIVSVGGSKWGDGFFDCLENIDKRNINLFQHDHTKKRIEFAQKNKLPYSWLLNQLKEDYRRGIGTSKLPIVED